MAESNLVEGVPPKLIIYEPMKKGYSRGLVDAGKRNVNVVAASSDVVSSTGTDAFANEFPDRFVEVGIAEQNLVTLASGMAAMGKMPFAAAYGAFSPGRNWEQIRTTICINNRPVKLIGTHVGLSDAPDGATHQILEDVALMRVLPNMSVIVPADSNEAYKATLALANYKKPAYMRIARDDTAIITDDDTPFEIGVAYVYRSGSDITLIATGRMTYYALLAADELAAHSIQAEVLHVPTIKPLDNETILKSVSKTGRAITVEEGQVVGGLGGAVAEVLSENLPSPLKRIGINDQFGQSGDPKSLFEHYGLTSKHITQAAQTMLGSK